MSMEIYLYLLLAAAYLYVAWVVEETIDLYYRTLFKEMEMNRVNTKLGALVSDKPYSVAEEVVVYKNPRRGYGLIWPILLVNFLLRKFAMWIARSVAATYDSTLLNTYMPRISVEEAQKHGEQQMVGQQDEDDTQILGFMHREVEGKKEEHSGEKSIHQGR